jgi:nitroreductase/NAD-dependent dihydropyrimidine dehydrogenase PreA subunit
MGFKLDIIEVNRETCKQDGICAAVCPSGLIDFEKGAYPKPVPEAEDVCIRCGHCVAACPTGSITHRVMSAEDCVSIQDGLKLTPEQCEHFLKSRRSIRVYKNKPLPRKDLERLIDIARYAPTGHNSQCVEWLVLADRDELHRLAGITIDWMRWVIEKMPEMAGQMHLDRDVKRWEEGTDTVLRDAPVVMIAHAEKDNRLAPTGCVIALTYLDLAAAGMGLGCCWAGVFYGAATTFPPMIKSLSLPEGHQCYGAMMMGYPKYSYHRIPRRKAPKITWRL